MEVSSTNNSALNETLEWDGGGFSQYSNIHFTVAAAVALGLCVFGLVGNIIVFWCLCFKIKRNKYTIYIINLAVADSILILFGAMLLMINIHSMTAPDTNFQGKMSLYLFIELCYDAMRYSGMFILTAISMERCISVLFPFWYQCHRPQNLSTIMCGLLWGIGCLESVIEHFVCTPEGFLSQTSECTVVEIMTFILAIGICLPIMVISSLTLLIKIKSIFREQYPPKMYIVIITTVFSFILSIIPINFLWFLMYFKLLPTDFQTLSFFFASIFCVLLNCTLNPYIYFMVGKKWKQSSSHSIQDALQRAFRVEDKESNDSASNKSSNISSQTNL